MDYLRLFQIPVKPKNNFLYESSSIPHILQVRRYIFFSIANSPSRSRVKIIQLVTNFILFHLVTLVPRTDGTCWCGLSRLFIAPHGLTRHHFAFIQELVAHEHVQKRGLADAVAAHDAYSISLVELVVEFVQNLGRKCEGGSCARVRFFYRSFLPNPPPKVEVCITTKVPDQRRKKYI